uniref:Uncharacterized protein n=1 Tax=Melanopsichium pennsylvanicum 4 TaxID=1398559 RepID=A0A077R3W4_9BASI|nr:uncharacterized protein BN887_06114 [Melanopsichium pennsylvanicum 4]
MSVEIGDQLKDGDDVGAEIKMPGWFHEFTCAPCHAAMLGETRSHFENGRTSGSVVEKFE